MKKILIFIVIVALLAVCWVIFFSGYDFDSAEQTLVESSYSVDRVEGSQFIESGILTGTLADYASSVGDIMVAFNGGTVTASATPVAVSAVSYSESDIEIVVAIELTSLSIVSDITSLLTSGTDVTALAGDIDMEALLELADDYPTVCELAEWVLSLSDSQRTTLVNRISYSVSGTTVLIGTSSAIALVG